MPSKFPSAQWLQDLHERLNSDEKYAAVARKWEGDISLIIEADDRLDETVTLYLDLWHGRSREVEYIDHLNEHKAEFIVSGPFSNWLRILEGDLNPIQAMATMKIKVRGNMAYIMRNVPTVLNFTRVAQETPFYL